MKTLITITLLALLLTACGNVTLPSDLSTKEVDANTSVEEDGDTNTEVDDPEPFCTLPPCCCNAGTCEDGPEVCDGLTEEELAPGPAKEEEPFCTLPPCCCASGTCEAGPEACDEEEEPPSPAPPSPSPSYVSSSCNYKEEGPVIEGDGYTTQTTTYYAVIDLGGHALGDIETIEYCDVQSLVDGRWTITTEECWLTNSWTGDVRNERLYIYCGQGITYEYEATEYREAFSSTTGSKRRSIGVTWRAP